MRTGTTSPVGRPVSRSEDRLPTRSIVCVLYVGSGRVVARVHGHLRGNSHGDPMGCCGLVRADIHVAPRCSGFVTSPVMRLR